MFIIIIIVVVVAVNSMSIIAVIIIISVAVFVVIIVIIPRTSGDLTPFMLKYTRVNMGSGEKVYNYTIARNMPRELGQWEGTCRYARHGNDCVVNTDRKWCLVLYCIGLFLISCRCEQYSHCLTGSPAHMISDDMIWNWTHRQYTLPDRHSLWQNEHGVWLCRCSVLVTRG